MGKSLERAGLTPGNKTRINPKVPKFIIEGSTEILKSAIKVYTADEANISQNRIHITAVVDEPKLIKYLDTLNQMKGIIKKGRKGEIYGKEIDIKDLKDYKEIFDIAKNKQSNILEGTKEVIANLLTKHGIKLKEKDIQIKTEYVCIYLYNRVSVTKGLYIKKWVVEKLHEILGGYPGYKELMYMNWTTLEKEPKSESFLSVTTKDIETLKRIGTQRNNYYIIPLDNENLPEEIRKKGEIPPHDILERQKKYFEEEVEILVEGRLIKIKGMPSRIKGEIILSLTKNIVSWKLIPALVEDIKKKWENIRKNIKKEMEKAEREQDGVKRGHRES